MSIRNFEKLFRPRSVVLIGASERPGSVGAVVARNLLRAGFVGDLLPVNPHVTRIDGVPVHRDVASLPHPPDLAVIATLPDTVPGLVAEFGARGTRAAIVITAGFGELGEHGRALQRAALDAARPYLPRLIGPNCIGLIIPGIGLDASFSHLAPREGDIAFSQSGATVTAMLDWRAPRGTVLGIARYFADPDRLWAEYAVAVRSDRKGSGVGYALMRRLIEIARQYRIGERVGDVLRENEPMLAMCRKLGFETTADPNDAALVRVRRKLV